MANLTPAAPYTLLATRLLVAGVFLWHGVPKAIDFAGAAEKFVGFGLPGVLGPIVGVAEVIAGILLAAGLFTRRAAAVLGVIIIGALATVQIPGGVTAGLERDLLVLLALLVLITHGPGAFALRRVVRS